MIAEWQSLRDELTQIEAAEHPAIVDGFGRTWIWWKGELYRHCGMAWTAGMIRSPHGLPSESVRSNPNYSLCEICRG